MKLWFHAIPAAAALASVCVCGPALAQDYSFQTIKIAGKISTNPTSFGPTGQAIGYDLTTTAKETGFVQDGTSVKTVSSSLGQETALYGYANGLFVGTATGSSGVPSTGFVMDEAGRMTAIAFPGTTYTEALGINKAGVVVGDYVPTGDQGVFDGFVDHNGVFTSIGRPNDEVTEVTGINSAGTMVGWSETFSSSPVGFMIHNGQTITISPPGAVETFVQGINDKGQIVGYYTTSPQLGFVGFVYDGKSYTTFVDPAGTSTYAYGINDAGQVAGFAITKTGDIGYIATPAAGG
jgi:hypothetical protein